MKDIRYTIEFFSNWHCGSGQAAGADVDELVIKDRDGLPFVPGRTIKGLLRDACDDLCAYGGLSKESVKTVFGFFGDNADEGIKGTAFFSDVVLPAGDRQQIVGNGWQSALFESVSATAIDDEGIAKDKSLRKIQTVVPCVLEGEVHNVPDDFVDWLGKAMSLVKRMGLGRNNGLGRCGIKIMTEERL